MSESGVYWGSKATHNKRWVKFNNPYWQNLDPSTKLNSYIILFFPLTGYATIIQINLNVIQCTLLSICSH